MRQALPRRLAVDWLKLNRPEEAIPFEVAQRLAVREIGIACGKPEPGRGKKTADNVSRFKHGNSLDYILARLDRDGFAELAAKVRAGQLSANAAAIRAGFRK
jgi:hypothetical protein